MKHNNNRDNSGKPVTISQSIYMARRWWLGTYRINYQHWLETPEIYISSHHLSYALCPYITRISKDKIENVPDNDIFYNLLTIRNFYFAVTPAVSEPVLNYMYIVQYCTLIT
jgi:hypothetical protein